MNEGSERFLIDANVLLNATFIRKGPSSGCLHALQCSNLSTIIDEMILEEAKKRCRKICLIHALSYVDAERELNKTLNRFSILVLPPGDNKNVSFLKKAKHDALIAHAAMSYNATLITNDITLLVECQDGSVEAVFPDSIIRKIYPDENIRKKFGFESKEYSANQSLKREQGVIFVRATPGAWRGTKSKQRFTLIDIPGMGSLFYDNGKSEWVFSMDTGKIIRQRFEFEGDGRTTACAQYRFTNRGGQASISAASVTPESSKINKQTILRSKLDQLITGKFTIGSDRNQSNGWCGGIHMIACGNEWIGPRHWKALVRLSHTMPRFGEGDRLEFAMRQLLS